MAPSKPKPEVRYRPYPKYPFPRVRGLRARLSPTRVIETAAWTKRGAWSSLIFVLFAGRFLRTKAKRRPQVLAVDKLEPGQSILVTTEAPPSRRG